LQKKKAARIEIAIRSALPWRGRCRS